MRKSKLSVIFWLWSFVVFGQSVPNTTTFTMQDVQTVVGYGNLVDCFTYSVADRFDYNYGSKTMDPKTLYGFRNYNAVVPPTVVLNPSYSYGNNYMWLYGNVTSDGGGTVTARGFVWNQTGSPTIANNKKQVGSGTGTYNDYIGSLSPCTLYYVRAYATNSAGTAYSTYEIVQTTRPNEPTVNLASVINITYNSATSGGTIPSDGCCTDVDCGYITAKGVVWNTTGTPTTANSKTNDGTGKADYTSTLTGLNPGTLYYIRAYATNIQGTSYSTQSSFTTAATYASVYTDESGTKTHNSITLSNNNVSSDGGATVTARGVCYSTSPNPSISGSHTTDGSGTGSFTSTITGLNSSTTYYLNAYATNSVGTAYGSQVSLTTDAPPANPPTVTTGNYTVTGISTVTQDYAVTADGGASVTARGVCWSTSANPTTADSKTNDGTGTGSFSASITGLSGATGYHVRAYATNSAGTAYGNDISMRTTLVDTPYAELQYLSIKANPVLLQVTFTTTNTTASDKTAFVRVQNVTRSSGWINSSSFTSYANEFQVSRTFQLSMGVTNYSGDTFNIQYSTDGGSTWTSYISVADGTLPFDYTQ